MTITNNQALWCLAKFVKHIHTNPTKAVMYVAPLMVAKLAGKLSDEVLVAYRKVAVPSLKRIDAAGNLPSKTSLGKDAAHVMGSSAWTAPHTITTVTHYRALLASHGCEL